MKNKIRIISIDILLICSLICILVIILLKKDDEQKLCNKIELESVLSEINLATDNYFSVSDNDSSMSMYIPIVFSEKINYIFAYAYDFGEDYFIIAENLGDDKISELRDYVEINSDKQIKIETHEQYTYMIFSEKYDWLIDGIIRNYIYCN